jgi:hypothetical protein
MNCANEKTPTKDAHDRHETRRKWLVGQLREGYAHVDLISVGEAIELWLEAWRELLGQVQPGERLTLQALSERVGLDDVLPNWFDDMLQVGRWLLEAEQPAVYASFERLLSTFSERFDEEPTGRVISVACTCADLLRSRGETEASEAAYAMIRASFPHHGQVVTALVDSRLDAVEQIDIPLLESCERLVLGGLMTEMVDTNNHNLSWLLQSLRADLHQARAFGGHIGCRWPLFEVCNWPAPIALYKADPYKKDAFNADWGEFLIYELDDFEQVCGGEADR